MLVIGVVSVAGIGLWQLNRPLPGADGLIVQTPPEDAVLIDARGSLAYRKGHLPGAYQLWSRDLLSFEGEVPGMLAEPNTIAAKLSRLGLEEGDAIVVYDGGDGHDAPLVALVLHAFGLDVKLLDGGVRTWQEQGGTLSTEPPATPESSEAELEFDSRLLVNAEETLIHYQENAIAPIDVREEASYLAGHIDRGVNLPVTRVHGGGTLPRWAELHGMLAPARITPDTHPLIYGSDLHEAARGWLALKAYGVEHLHVYSGPFEGLVRAGLPVSEAPSERAVSERSGSVCWR